MEKLTNNLIFLLTWNTNHFETVWDSWMKIRIFLDSKFALCDNSKFELIEGAESCGVKKHHDWATLGPVGHDGVNPAEPD